MTENFLKNMAKESFKRFQVAADSLAEKDLLSLCEGMEHLEAIDLPSNDFHIITEIKKQSPSMGRLAAESFDVEQQAMSYIDGGASLLSVLTEPSRFSGGLEDLQVVADLEHSIPVMRKDFLVHPYQVSEARHYGANGVLIILAIVDEGQIRAMIQRALDHGMFVLLEAFTKKELHLATRILTMFAGQSEQLLVGVNCRDLNTLEVHFSNFEKLATDLPSNTICVAESGVNNLEYLQCVIEMGFGAALIGTALMQSNKTTAKLHEMKQFARKTMVARP